MKKLFLIISLCATQASFSQSDTLVFKNGLESPVEVIKKGLHHVFVKVKENGTEKVVKIPNKSLDYILNQDGEMEFIDSYWNRKYPDYGRNLVEVDLAGWKDKSFAFAFQHLSKNGIVGFKIPFQVHLDNNRYQAYKGMSYTNQFSKVRVGCDINVFPFGQRIISYYFGFSTSYSLVDMLNPNYDVKFADYKPADYFRYDQKFLKNTHEVGLTFQNGVLYRITKNLFADAGAGIGPCAYFTPKYRTMSVQLYGHLSVGWAF